MFYVYILQSKKNNETFYTGYTTNIKRRLNEHNRGSDPSTNRYRPWKMVWVSIFQNETLAREFERYLKSGSGRAFRNKHLI